MSSNLALGTNPTAVEGTRVDDDAMRAAIAAHFIAIGRDEDEAGAIYADDAVLEYIQSGERSFGRDAIIATRKAYPGRPGAFSVSRISGADGQWVAELVLRFDGEDPHSVAAILDVRDGRVTREARTRRALGAPAYRAPWVQA